MRHTKKTPAPDSVRIQAHNDDGTVVCYDGKTRKLDDVYKAYAAWQKGAK